jgi:TetR/AcrR family transcriptional repressor of nem operon
MPQRNLKEQLVGGGFEVLYEKGYHAASVNDIVAAASVPKGSFYNHFDSKEALALEVARRYGERYDLEGLAGGAGPPLARLRAFFEDLVAQNTERGVEYGCLIGNFSTELATHSEPIRELVAVSFEAWSAAVTSALAQAQAAGELDESLDAERLGPYIVDSYEGAVARAKVSGDRAPLDRFVATTFEQLLAR